QRKDHRNNKGNKAKIIFGDYTHERETRFHKIIRFFTGIYHYGNNRNGQNGEQKGHHEFFKNIPVENFHALLLKAFKSNRKMVKAVTTWFSVKESFRFSNY